jgi:hypothetical protein
LVMLNYHDPGLWFTTKARARKGAGWENNLGVIITFLKVWESVRE